MISKLTSIAISLCILPGIILASSPAESKIHKRILRDGAVEYYNVEKGKSTKKYTFTSEFNPLIEKLAGQYRVDDYLVKCIIKVESNFYPNAVSVAGAMGLMQLMQETADYYNVKNPLDPEENLDAGIRHFKSLMDYFDNEVPLALAAYHAGLGRVRRRMAVPPIKSTMEYVDRIMLIYNGKKSSPEAVKKLYKKIDKDGTILIYSR